MLVKIVDIHVEDAFFRYRDQLIGSLVELGADLQLTIPGGWYGGRIVFSEPVPEVIEEQEENGAAHFYAFKFQRVQPS